MPLWTERVAQDRKWEHNGPIGEQFGGPWQQGQLDYFYDICSNIHYGYVGRAGSFLRAFSYTVLGLGKLRQTLFEKIRSGTSKKGLTVQRTSKACGHAGMG